jgi:hypothetical protein
VPTTLAQLRGDLARQVAILGIGKVELLPISMFGAVALLVDAQRVGISLRKPRRRAAVAVPITL